MPALKYLEGDATQPQSSGVRVIAHCCNDSGGWGSGFVVALSKRWQAPEKAYRYWYACREYQGTPFRLGAVTFVPVDWAQETWVANIIGQHRTIRTGETTPIRYEALAQGFVALKDFCIDYRSKRPDISVHMPRIGAGLARGDWNRIEALIQSILVTDGGLDVSVYDLPGQPFIASLGETPGRQGEHT